MNKQAFAQAPNHEQKQALPALKRELFAPLPEKARVAFEAIGIHIHEPTDDAPLLARWQRAVA